jgi:hypothetical protein
MLEIASRLTKLSANQQSWLPLAALPFLLVRLPVSRHAGEATTRHARRATRYDQPLGIEEFIEVLT